MGAVYEARHIRLNKNVAMKLLTEKLGDNPTAATRFQREMQAVGLFEHPNVVQALDAGEANGVSFLVMELIEGGTLRELLRERGPMPPHAVVAVLRPVLSGLGVAHQAGLVHRDVKPENVLISDDGEVKLVDFGLVRAIAEAGITSTSVILGTAAYLSPEQVAGTPTGPRSDVYSAGIMAFELLTGTTPFQGDNALAVASQRLDREVPPPSTIIDGVPPQFDHFIAQATAIDPTGRFEDALDMAAELDVIADELVLPKFRVPAPKNSAQHAAATALLQRVAQPNSPPGRQQTRQFTPTPGYSEDRVTDAVADEADEDPEFPRQFAGIDIDDFVYARLRARRMVVFWVLAVLVLTGLVGVAAWTVGLNFPGLIGP